MRCKNCNGNLRFEDKFCPYCGAQNTAAVQHQKDMENFKEDYEAVKKDVIDTATKHSISRARIFTNLILLVCILLIPLIMTFTGMFLDEAIRSKSLTKEEKNTFMSYIEQEDYINAYIYSDINDFYYKVDYEDELNFYIDLVYEYTNVYNVVLNYLENDLVLNDYYDRDINKELIQVITFYYDTEKRLKERTTYEYIEKDYSNGLEFVDKMNKEVEDLLFTFLDFDITQEEYHEMGNNNKLAAIERSIYSD